MKELIAESFVDTQALLQRLNFLSCHHEFLPDGHQTVHHTHCWRVYGSLLSCYFCHYRSIQAIGERN